MDTKAIDARFAPVRRSKTFARILSACGLKQKRVLDIGCGYGEYLALFGEGSMGVTTNPEEAAYARARSLHVVVGNAERLEECALPTGLFDAVWANNLFEHLLSPHAFLMTVRKTVLPGGTLVLGVPVVPFPSLLLRFRKFRGALADAHINFFTGKTLTLTVARAGWRVRAVRPFLFAHPFLDALASPFAPHLYVLAEHDTKFQYPEKKLKEWENDPQFSSLLASTGQGTGHARS